MKPADLAAPLWIDSVVVDRCGGVIGMTLCPGKRGAPFFPGDRDLDIDLAAIRDWGASALVSLMEMEEMEWFGVTELPDKAVELGLRHYHLPITDMDVPGKRFEENWQTAGEELKGLLLAGEAIVIHCLAGLGRTGTVAARLLIELGMEPEAAVRHIRQARPGTIQSMVQEVYVRRCKWRQPRSTKGCPGRS